MLYKSQILSYLESGSVAFFHAPDTTMNPLDRIQQRFLREIGVSEKDAMLRFNQSPLAIQRQIAALGLLHRRVLNKTPSVIGELLPFASSSRHSYHTRLQSALHDKQLWDPAEGLCTEVFRRSIFGYIRIYNRLS